MNPATFRIARATSRQALHRRLLIALIALACVWQPSAASGFGGGMTGYFQYADLLLTDGRASGMAWGLGGILNYHLSRHFRVSGFGSTYRLRHEGSAVKGSYLDMGYGGIGPEFLIPMQSGTLAFGCMIGGGRTTSLFIWSASPGDLITARYESRGLMIAVPIISYEHALSKSAHILLRTEYLVGVQDGGMITFGSPGIRVGVMFRK